MKQEIGKLIEMENKEFTLSKDNRMRDVQIEKMILHFGGTEDKLDKGVKLLEMITKNVGINNKVYVVKSKKRIPAFGISPGKKSGAKITIRDGNKIKKLLNIFLAAIENRIKKEQISQNQLCLGVHEYIEVPGLEYNRDIGIMGFEIMIVFKRKGKSVKLKKIKKGKYPKKQNVSQEEIVSYLINNFKVEVIEK